MSRRDPLGPVILRHILLTYKPLAILGCIFIFLKVLEVPGFAEASWLWICFPFYAMPVLTMIFMIGMYGVVFLFMLLSLF